VIIGAPLGMVATIICGGLELPLLALPLPVLFLFMLVTAALPGTERRLRAGHTVREPAAPSG